MQPRGLEEAAAVVERVGEVVSVKRLYRGEENKVRLGAENGGGWA